MVFMAVQIALAKEPSAGIIEQVAAAFNSKDAGQVASYFDVSVEVTLLSKESSYSKSQAQAVLADFFSKNAVKSFTLNHQGNSPDGSTYGIGTLSTASGNYRTYYYLKQKGGQYVIQELRLEKE